LLTYSKEREPEYENCFPNQIINDVCELVEERAKKHELKIVKDFDPSIDEVSMDPRAIHRAMLNLVSNAIDACIFYEDENKNWEIRVKTANEEDHIIRFEVQDNGVGMNQETIDNLFTSFFSTKGDKGTGLGLAVTKKLVEEHKGTIDVESQPGKGATFTIRLPYDELNKDS
jgi:signal transduction histidine kinase